MVSVAEEHRMAATTQAPITVSLETKDKIRYLAAFEDVSPAEIAPVRTCSGEPTVDSLAEGVVP
jgi:hypothetical protein